MNCPHCNVHIDEHPAGPCMNVWVATDVMGWEWEPFWPEGTNTVGNWHHEAEDDYTGRPSPYSTDIAAAWKVLERLSADGYSYQVLEHSDPKRGDCLCELWKDFYRWNVNHQPTVPIAICKAAIKAVQK